MEHEKKIFCNIDNKQTNIHLLYENLSADTIE